MTLILHQDTVFRCHTHRLNDEPFHYLNWLACSQHSVRKIAANAHAKTNIDFDDAKHYNVTGSKQLPWLMHTI